MTRELVTFFLTLKEGPRGLDRGGGRVDSISDYSSMIGNCLSSPHLSPESKGFFNC